MLLLDLESLRLMEQTKASEVSSQYKVIYNNLVTGGESAVEATKKVKEMQEDGAKYSIKYGVSQKEVADGYLELVKRGYSSSQALGAMNTELQGPLHLVMILMMSLKLPVGP